MVIARLLLVSSGLEWVIGGGGGGDDSLPLCGSEELSHGFSGA